MSDIGRVVTDDEIEDAVVAILRAALPTYLSHVEQGKGLAPGFWVRPKSWSVRNDIEHWPEETLPHVIIVSTGLTGQPVKEGRGTYRVPWYIGVGAVVSADNQLNTRRMAYGYAAAIRTLMVQQQSLGQALDGTVRGVTWMDGRNGEMPPEDGRTLWMSRQVFEVEVGNVLTQPAGPLSFPDPDPVPPPPTADPTVPDREHVQTSYTKEPLS